MLLKSDEEILTERLRNWGRWAADNNHLTSSTLLWRMMKLYGEKEEGKREYPDEEKVPPHPIDIFDAVIVNRAWQCLPESPLRYKTAKWVLVAHYCYPHMPQAVALRRLRLNQKTYDQLLTMAKYLIFNLIEKDAAKRFATREA